MKFTTYKHLYHNLWLDSAYPIDDFGNAGRVRGDCPIEGNDPLTVENENRNAYVRLGRKFGRKANGHLRRSKVSWSNIRFGPIGSTVSA